MARPRTPKRDRGTPEATRASPSAAAAPGQPRAATPPPPLARDRRAWAALLVLVFVVARAWGVPFGEPVADDFDHLHHVLFSADRSWLGGGGSASFWRPLAYQGYYQLFTGVILAHPAWIAVLHTLLAAVAMLAVYDALRRRVAPEVALLAAVSPWLIESARALLVVPVHIVDLGLIVFSALAWRAAAAGRLAWALAALAAALLCKETAVVTALVLPWLAPRGRPRRAWFALSAAVALGWGVLYVVVRSRLALELPHGLEAGLAAGRLLDPARILWALSGTWRAWASLPMASSPADGVVLGALLALLLGAAVALGTQRAARARLSAVRGVVAPALAWGVLATATLVTVHPVWSPERVVFAALGFSAALMVTLACVRPTLALAALALQLVMFVRAPAAPSHVTREAPQSGAFVDFERLARLQRLMREARTTLRTAWPALPAGARVAMLHPPFMADYAAGDKALQVWYRDSTFHWVRWNEMAADEARSLTAAMEFQEDAEPQFRKVEPEALHSLFEALALVRAERFPEAAAILGVADVQLTDPLAHHVRGRIWGLRAWCLASQGQVRAGDSLARASLAIAPENADGHLTMAALHTGHGDYAQGLAHLDTLETWYPGYPVAVEMRKAILARRQQAMGSGPPSPPIRPR